ncbi:MAG: LapA family protein [Gracilibacteraceae bacterium]|jgi:uncharacterized integral membrane protein|nr:LapA family protein [Gracilibacteraceae bacterium]
MAGIGLILAIIIALAVVIFTVQNAATVSVSFILWTADTPLAVVIFCSVLAGALLMFCLVLYKSLRDKWRSRRTGKTEEARPKDEDAAVVVSLRESAPEAGNAEEPAAAESPAPDERGE